MEMRRIASCFFCICICGGCCVCEKIGEAMGRAIREALAQVLAQNLVADVMDPPLTYADAAVFDVQAARPEVLPWYAGAEVARFAFVRLGLATSPTGFVSRLVQGT